MTQKIYFHKNDLPDNIKFNKSVAIDTETSGLNLLRDKLCLIQLSFGNDEAHLIKFNTNNYNSPNLKRLFNDIKILKIFHFARFDVAIIKKYLNVNCYPIYCTKIASKLIRTYTNTHSLENLCYELIGVSLDKTHQSSDWCAENLSKTQQKYAASDVFYLHRLKEKLNIMLIRENRIKLAENCFNFINTRVELDLLGWNNQDIFSHKN